MEKEQTISAYICRVLFVYLRKFWIIFHGQRHYIDDEKYCSIKIDLISLQDRLEVNLEMGKSKCMGIKIRVHEERYRCVKTNSIFGHVYNYNYLQ